MKPASDTYASHTRCAALPDPHRQVGPSPDPVVPWPQICRVGGSAAGADTMLLGHAKRRIRPLIAALEMASASDLRRFRGYFDLSCSLVAHSDRGRSLSGAKEDDFLVRC